MSDERQRALSFLPHGPEFRFVDSVTQLTPGKRGTGQYHLRGDEQFLRGHFPDQPLMPGVLLVEAGAQLAGVIAQSDPSHLPLKDLKLTAIRQVKILGAARPGESILLEAEVIARMGGLVQARVSASLRGERIMEGEVVLAGAP